MIAQACFLTALVASVAAFGVRNPLTRPGAFVPSGIHLSVSGGLVPSRKSPSLFLSPTAMPRIQSNNLNELATQGYTVIQDFIPDSLQQTLRDDVSLLREKSKFKVAKVGQDSTNTLDEDIRVAETCFIGNGKLQDVPSRARSELYSVLGQLRDDLSGNPILNSDAAVTKGTPPLDKRLDETLYAYYPQGGFYRRHLDAVSESASYLRCYSLLLYLNEAWQTTDGGQLRLYGDRGGYDDVLPHGGTLVLFKSDMIPHEVLDTNKERVAVVGWYNRGVSPADIASLAPDGDKTRSVMLVASAALVSVGIGMILLQ